MNHLLKESLNGNTTQLLEEIGDNHIATSIDTPLKQDAFSLTEEEKIFAIEERFAEIMDILGLDLNDDSLSGTPRRVAKMFVKEIFGGLSPDNKPAITLFENKFGYRNMVIERNIPLHSTCEHHFLPIRGKAHLAYFSSGKVIGLSKLNRIVEFFARRPQVQERLTQQIFMELKKVLETDDIAVYIDAEHFCVQSRGIKHHGSSTITAEYGGKFLNRSVKQEFLQAIGVPFEP